MSFFRKFLGLFLGRGFYEGGKRTAANRDFWNATSDFENTASPDRDTMRARARWLHENNPIMANIDKTIVNNVIGTGIRLQSKTGNKKLDDAIERRFEKWVSECDISGQTNFYDMQRIILESRMVDGEILIHKKVTKDGLRLQLIEADALDTSKGTSGITLDDSGAPKTYHFRVGMSTADVPADQIINYFRKERASQIRGISEYKQSIIDIKNFSAFQSATIQAARARANISYVVESNREKEVFGATNKDGEELVDINGLMVYYLREGEQIKSFDSNNGGSNYGEFIRSAVRLISVARNVTYELAFRDYSQVNFTSGRMGGQQDNRRFDQEQSHIALNLLGDIFKDWLQIEIMMGNLPVPRTDDAEKHFAPKWSYPRREWVKPVEDLAAAQMEIDMGGLTNTDFCASRGQDFEENLRTKKKEIELKRKILGDDFDLIMAIEQKNKELLIAAITTQQQEDGSVKENTEA